MEHGLAVATRPDDPTRQPRVAATRVPIPAAPGRPARGDDAYERQGTAHRVRVFEPWAGQRRVNVTARRPAVDFAHRLRAWVDAQDPQADALGLVRDHLNMHNPAALSEACAPVAARRLRERREMPDTPNPGRWLKMAETDRSVLATPGVDRRIADPTPLTQEVAAGARQRHTAKCRVEWRVTTRDASITLKRLYPSIQLG